MVDRGKKKKVFVRYGGERGQMGRESHSTNTKGVKWGIITISKQNLGREKKLPKIEK